MRCRRRRSFYYEQTHPFRSPFENVHFKLSLLKFSEDNNLPALKLFHRLAFVILD